MLKSHFNLVGTDSESEEEVIEAEVIEESVEEELPPRLLQRSEVCTRLSMLGKTASGDGYTFLKCKLVGMRMTSIDAIKCYKHIMFLDVSNNYLDLHALQVITQLPNLILIHADENRLTSAGLKQMRYLQVIIFNNNQITSLEDVFQEQLSTLELGFNKLTKIDFKPKMPTMRVLDLRNNLITEIPPLEFPRLDSLYLAGNKIKTLTGIELLVNLRVLHVRNNPIRYLDGFNENQTKLQYINLRNCRVTTLRQVKKMKVLKALDTIVLTGCPYMGGAGEEDPENKEEEDDPQIRVELVATMPRLKRINKTAVTSEEREESKELLIQWAEEGEKDEEEIENEQQQGEEEISNAED
ncbi:leucine-rich repeat-containing protein 23-like [Spodoptera litura]|uniref:Leucine-rich repeat-containing protein 23-like n=1 Tax=Spodoptera litura TaxID=69820 RepID=A0A9J7E0Y8_SPOLT|nr:leucine-rich repeat-containing protein 23-like [Spodoptera litura]